MVVYALTTKDNPFDPIDQFDDWFRFDTDKGYGTCSYLDRVSYTSNQLTEEENQKEIERAIDEILKHDVLGIYEKVKRNVE